jgi:N-acetylglucosaminyldiphosphoundecaprenol N-acetyl-beta-D-mannosaminyltransferase
VVTDSELRLLGVRVDDVDMAEAVRSVERFIRDGPAHRVVTVNLEYVRHACRSREFAAALEAADLAVPDGAPVVWVSRLTPHPLRERVTGVDLTERCAALAAARGYRLFLLGAEAGVAREAARVLEGRYAGLKVAGIHSPPLGDFSEEEEERICSRIRAAQPHILLVALPTPRQELWNHANATRWHVPVTVGVGAAFDMLSGRRRRAPDWMQRRGLEWFFRLLLEPRRLWKRYLVHDAVILLRIFLSLLFGPKRMNMDVKRTSEGSGTGGEAI